MDQLSDLPGPYQTALTGFVENTKTALGTDLVSVVLFGSAAEARIRSTSDVNLILVLNSFLPAKVAAIREAYRSARAAINLQIMFLLESEIPKAAEAFAVKFADISARHRILHGPDPFSSVSIPASAIRQAVRQMLLNLTIRLRERYVLISLREDRLALTIAESAAPLRACAASILHLEGRPASSPKEALERLVAELNEPAFLDLLPRITEARNTGTLPPGEAEPVFVALIGLADALQQREQRLP